MDSSMRRVLEALGPGPAVAGILWTSYNMELEEAQAALAAAVDEGYVEQIGSMSFGLTSDGTAALRSLTGEQGHTAEEIKQAGTAQEQQAVGGVEGTHVGAPRRFGRGAPA